MNSRMFIDIGPSFHIPMYDGKFCMFHFHMFHFHLSSMNILFLKSDIIKTFYKTFLFVCNSRTKISNRVWGLHKHSLDDYLR